MRSARRVKSLDGREGQGVGEQHLAFVSYQESHSWESLIALVLAKQAS